MKHLLAAVFLFFLVTVVFSVVILGKIGINSQKLHKTIVKVVPKKTISLNRFCPPGFFYGSVIISDAEHE